MPTFAAAIPSGTAYQDSTRPTIPAASFLRHMETPTLQPQNMQFCGTKWTCWWKWSFAWSPISHVDSRLDMSITNTTPTLYTQLNPLPISA